MSELCDLLKIREALGKSQSEFAEVLGVSLRAIQSYEQGWRATPPLVQKMAVLLMLLQNQKTNKVQPCWKVKGCASQDVAHCRGAQVGGGCFCWMVSGNIHDGKKLKSWEAKAAKCRKCDVLKQWMPA